MPSALDDPFNRVMEVLVEALKTGGPGMFMIVIQDLMLGAAMLVPRRAAWCVVLIGLAVTPTVTGVFFYRHSMSRPMDDPFGRVMTPERVELGLVKMRKEALPLLWFGGGSTVIGAAVLRARCRRRGAGTND